MLTYFLISCLLIYTEGHPKYRRHKRDDDVGGITYAPCKDTYSQCPEWKKSGMCEMPQYKDYMPLVCTDTCGFCKEVRQEEIAEIAAPKDLSAGDKVPNEYTEQLKRYYETIEQQQKAYQATIQQYQQTEYSPAGPETGTLNAETGNLNTGLAAPTTADVSSPINTDTASSNLASPYPAYSNNAALNSPAPSAYQPYGSQPYPPYGPYNNPDNSSSSSSSSSSSGSKSSSSTSSSSDSSTSTSISVGLSPLNTSNQTESAGNASVNEASSLPSKVAPETPSLPALPPLLVLPPISESLLVDDSSKINTTTPVDKEPNEKQKAALQQAADSKPYPPERGATTKTEGAKVELVKDEGTKVKHKSHGKSEPDRKVITEDQSTNEMTKSESKHLAVSLHGHNLEDENNEEEEEDEQKMIKAFSDDPGKLQMNKGLIKKKNMDLDLKDTTKQKLTPKREKSKPSENEDAVFKHDEKSVSVSGSGAGGLEESFEDLNYITDFNPDDFDMDLPDISHKNLLNANDKRNAVEFPKDHPLFSRSGIQKARSEITAPTIIDATEHGISDNAESVLNDAKDHTRSKIHSRSKSSSTAAPKADINKEEVSSGRSESETDEEENSGMQSDEKSNLNEDEADEDNDKEKKENKKVTAEKKNIVKEHAQKNIVSTKSKTAETKSSVATVDNKIIKTSTKGKTTANKKSKVIEKKNEKYQKESLKHVSKEKSESEVSELMSEKGDTAAVRNKKAEKKSRTTVVKKVHKSKANSLLSTRKEIPKTKVETDVEATRKKTETKTDETETTIADLSGAGSGEIDTDILSGESPFRSSIESGEEPGDRSEEEEEEEEDGEEDADDEEEPAHQRQNFQLNGDPEMVDLKPKTANPQPDLNDFPDKVEEKSNYSEEEGNENEATEAAETNKDDEEGELDDLKIEELLKPEEDKKKKKKKKKPKTKKEKAQASLKEGKISMVLQQNYNQHYDKKDSPSYQMLAGNIKKDIEKTVKGASVKDVAFSEVSVEGNPRQSGKTKASFNIDASSNEWMKKLLKLVDGGDIDGLKVIKGSLEIEEE